MDQLALLYWAQPFWVWAGLAAALLALQLSACGGGGDAGAAPAAPTPSTRVARPT